MVWKKRISDSVVNNFSPVGLYGLIRNETFNKSAKIVLGIVFGFWSLLLIIAMLIFIVVMFVTVEGVETNSSMVMQESIYRNWIIVHSCSIISLGEPVDFVSPNIIAVQDNHSNSIWIDKSGGVGGIPNAALRMLRKLPFFQKTYGLFFQLTVNMFVIVYLIIWEKNFQLKISAY